MASPFQQQALRRKVIYFGLILVLFTIAFAWRTNVVAEQAQRLALREVDRGDVELTGSVIRLSLTGSRGLATCALWISAIDKQKRNQWNELELLVRSVTKLQPHFITPWLFQSWNLSYNVSVNSDRVSDKYFYITRGIELLADGERKNSNHPDLRYWIGFYNEHKICKSDETNVQRSLFQLTLIPPNERDPARFKQINPATGLEEINWIEFEDFCKKHPQLVRRLNDGMIRDTKFEADRQFKCGTADQVVRFLADNQRVPSPWEDAPIVAVGQWQKRDDDKLRPVEEQFPPLPPRRTPTPPQRLYSDRELVADQVGQLGDDIDAYAMARAWFAYAQEPIPDPDELPGETKPITDRRLQRRPKQIMTVIFRNYPALAQSNIAERLQQEGWFDSDLFSISGWFPADKFPADKEGKRFEAKVGDPGVEWSQRAWADAHQRWRRYGEENHFLFKSEADEENMKNLSAEFRAQLGIEGARPPILRTENMDQHMRDGYFAAQFLYENGFCRQTTNFDSHYNRSFVDSKPEAVKGRKNFYKAERLRWAQASRGPALELYATTLPYWRDEVLLKNKEYLRSSVIQDESYDWEYRYMRLFDEIKGDDLRRKLGKAAQVLPLLPAVDSPAFPAFILRGPLDVLDENGHQLIDADTRTHVLSRKPPLRPRTMDNSKQSSTPGQAK
jgi:hypothetical protein